MGRARDIVERGQASPRDIESTCVREDGQIGAKPSTKTDHSVGSRMTGTDVACVVGCEIK